MHPILFTFPKFLPLLGGHSIHVYGLMIALAFLLGLVWVKYESRRMGLDEAKMIDFVFYLMIAGLVGSRLFYIFDSVPDFWSDPLVLFRVWQGGLVFQGGVIGSVVVAIWLTKKYKLRFFQTADVFAPALSLGHGLGRVGCFFAGCCFGKQCPVDFPLGITFPPIPNGIAPHDVPLYPTQLTEVVCELIIFTILFIFRKKKKFDGSVFLLYVMLYSVLRYFIEFFRGDISRGFVIEPYLSNGQFVGLISIGLAIFFWIYLAKRAKKAT
ncbi:MAG: hypothetical protein ACD_62C00248G0001 [uncultured bacterium]|nr:MAG: hypothetical protein ACD_62C00248G0001 [uncultured bacterium]